ncbi:MAG: hypothetical protein GY858_00950 [Candidatus Omnitrophica bacterium]|nr:hypothetical protein [Candidatus Omnitrophota bacterium]
MKNKVFCVLGVLTILCSFLSVMAADGDLIVNGNVGIGTTSPSSLLTLKSPQPSFKIFEDDAVLDNGCWRMMGHAENLYFSTVNNDNNLAITWMRIERTGIDVDRIILPEGYVGIGTASPSAKLHVNGNFVASGTKNFEINHPTKPGKKLIHACIEGPEAGLYYRGRGKLKNGKAAVKLPEYFEALARKKDRTIQLTARGPMPYVLSCSAIKDGKFIAYGSKKDGVFYWEVKAVRADVDVLLSERDGQVADSKESREAFSKIRGKEWKRKKSRK